MSKKETIEIVANDVADQDPIVEPKTSFKSKVKNFVTSKPAKFVGGAALAVGALAIIASRTSKTETLGEDNVDIVINEDGSITIRELVIEEEPPFDTDAN